MTKPDAKILRVSSLLARPGREPATGPVAISIEDGRIAAIEPVDDAPAGTLAFPAAANAHDHGRGLRTLAFGAVDDALELWIPTLAREPKLDAYRRAAVAFARMAEGGIAATNHSHGTQDPANALGEAEAVSRAARDVGIHVAFAAPFMDRNALAYGDPAPLLAEADPLIRPALEAQQAAPRRPVADYLAEIEAMAEFEHETFHVQYCPVGPQWVSEEALAAIAEASARSGRRVHMHLLETRYQREWADATYRQGIVRFLDEVGMLSPRLSVAHGVYLDAADCALLAERGVVVSVNTSSNLRLRSGIPPVPTFLEKGVAFGIGLDAQPLDDDDDILREMRLVWLHNRGFGIDDVLTPERLFEAAFVDGRRTIVGDGGGKIEVGAPADLIVLDYGRMAPDLLAADAGPIVPLLTRATRRFIRTMVVGGRTIVEDGVCVSVDRPALEAELIAQARAAWAETPPDDAFTAARKRVARHYYGCGCHMAGAQRFAAE